MSEQSFDPAGQPIPYSLHTQQNIARAATIARYVAIIMIVNLALQTVTYFIKPAAITIASREGFNDNMIQVTQQAGTGFSILIGIIINSLLIYGLLRFSKHAKLALQHQSAAGLTRGIGGLGIYFKVMGFLIITCIGVAAIMLLAGGLGAAFK